MDKLSFFLINVFFNSLLAFFTTVFLIKMIHVLFRIREGRFSSILKTIPIIKLPLDLFLYDFSRWSYNYGINPLYCKEGTRSLSILLGWTNPAINRYCLPLNSGIEFSVPGNMTFTIADVVGYLINPKHLQIFSVLFLILSSFALIKKLTTYYFCKKAVNCIVMKSSPETRKIDNPTLLQYIKQIRCPILSSSVLQGSPFVAGLFKPIIFFPKNLALSLSQKEYEAALAHEIEHIRQKDTLIRFVLDLIQSIFWWIPTKWLKTRIEEAQEIGCDKKCTKYGVDSVDLASVLHKSAKKLKNTNYQSITLCLASHVAVKRIKNLLQTKQPPKKRYIFCALAFGISFLLILFGRFWIF